VRGQGRLPENSHGLGGGFLLNALTLLPPVAALCLFARPVTSVFFAEGFSGAAYDYAVRYVSVYLPFVYVQLVGHILHAYMRSLGSVNTVLGITLLGSAVRVVSTVLLVPVMHIEGAYLGQIISWAVDAVVSVGIVFCLYRTREQLKQIVERIHQKA